MSNKEKNLTRFAVHLTKLRKEKGMSIRQLAAAAGLEYSQIQRIEKGKVNFAFTTLLALSQGLDMDVNTFLEEYRIPK